MNRSKEEIVTILNEISAREPDFTYNEEAILEEYHPDNESETSLPIKLLSIFGGILATITFSGALFIAGIYKSGTTMAMMGIILIALGIFINTQKKVILDTISICAYILGYVLLGLGMIETFGFDSEKTYSAIFLLIGCITLFLNRTYVMAFISVLIIISSVFNLIGMEMYLMKSGLMVILMVGLYYFLSFESKIITSNKRMVELYNPIRIGIIVSILLQLIIEGFLFRNEFNFLQWPLSIAAIVLLMFTVKSTIEKVNLKESGKQFEIYAVALLIFASCFTAPYILISMLILILSFRVAYTTGFVIGIVSVLYFVTRYYYDLEYDLLTKSILMLITGSLFLLFYLMYKKAANK